MSATDVIAVVLFLVLVPLSVGTAVVILNEGARERRDARWLSRRR